MADQQDEGQGPQPDQEEFESKPWQRQALPSAGKKTLGNVASYVAETWKRKWIAVVLLAVSLVLFILFIVFAGVWAAYIKGYGGESAHNPAAKDQPEKEVVVGVMKASDRKLGSASTDKPIRRAGPKEEKPQPSPVSPGIIDYCQLVIPDSIDRQFLEEGYRTSQAAIGVAENVLLEPDRRLFIALEYLCRRHRRLGVSHIISAYINMRLDPEQKESRDPQIIKNISAHNRGQALDLVEIDFVYKVYRLPCPPSPRFTVEYWNDRNQMLLALPCKEAPTNVNTTFQGAPAQAIPIQVVWQDQKNQFALGGLPLNINTALSALAARLGLPTEALQHFGGSFERLLSQIGRVHLAELLGLPAGSLSGGSLAEILNSAFQAKLAELTGTLPRPEWGRTMEDWVRSAGAAQIERALGLFPGSLQGWRSPEDLLRTVGLETAANILRIPSNILSDPARAAEYLRSLSPADWEMLAQDQLGAGVIPIISAIRAGDQAAASQAIVRYGQEIMEKTLSLPAGVLGSDISSRRAAIETVLPALAERTGLPQESLRKFLSPFVEGGSFAAFLTAEGLPILATSLGLPEGELRNLLAGGRLNLDATTLANLARRFGLDETVIKEVFSAIRAGQDLLLQMERLGSALLSQAMGLSDPLALFQIATGKAPQELLASVQNELNRLAEELNLPAELVDLTKLLSGQAPDLETVFLALGGQRLGDIFGLPLADIKRLLAGDISALLNLPAFQELARSLFSSLGLNMEQISNLIKGNPLLSGLAQAGDAVNGLMSALGIDQFLVMERVYRPEARHKVHLVIKELLDMPFVLDDIDLRVTQLITYSYERDVRPFERDGTLDKVYGRNRSRNFGLFAMKEASDHLHIAY